MKVRPNKGINSISDTTNFILNLLFSVYVFLCVYPLILVFAISITDEKALTLNGYNIIPSKISFYAYQYILSDSSQIIRSYCVTIFVTLVGSLVSLLITAAYAYPISRKDFKRRNLFSFIVYFTMLFNGGLVPWYMVYVKILSIKNTIWVLIIPMLLTPFFVLIMRTFFASTIPDSIMESAKIDGASEIRIFFRIVLPLSLPVLATIGLFNTLMYWNDWFLSLMFITDNKIISLQYLLYKILVSIQYLAEAQSRSGQSLNSITNLPGETARMAMCIIGIGPIVLAYPFFQKYFVKGLTIGAVKG